MNRTTKQLTQVFFLFATIILLAAGMTGQTRAFRQLNPNGGSSTNELTGKTPAVAGAQPWMVSLASSSEANGYQAHFCGGSLISAEWVLTAAHCLEGESASSVDIIINRHTLSSNAGERIPAAKIINHPGYTNTSDGEDNDIALIKLSRPATQGQPITLITNATEQLDDAGTMARVTGWGRVPEKGLESTDVLHGVNIPMVSQADCQAVFAADGGVTGDSICAGFKDGGADSCEGDSGGPLIVPNGNSWVQVGIVSYGGQAGCGVAPQYGVYARVTSYENWIQQHVGSLAGPTDPVTPPTEPTEPPTEPTEPTEPPTGEPVDSFESLAPAGYEFEGMYEDGDSLVVYFGNENGDYIDLVISPDYGDSLEDLLDFEGDVYEVNINGTTVLVETFDDDDYPYSTAVFSVDGELYTIAGTVDIDTVLDMAEKLI